MTWQWRRQGRIPLVNIVAGKNSSNRMTFCKKDNIVAPRIKRDTLQKDLLTEGLLYLAEGLMYPTEGLLYLVEGLLYLAEGHLYPTEGLLYLAEGLSNKRTSVPCRRASVPYRRTYVPCRRRAKKRSPHRGAAAGSWDSWLPWDSPLRLSLSRLREGSMPSAPSGPCSLSDRLSKGPHVWNCQELLVEETFCPSQLDHVPSTMPIIEAESECLLAGITGLLLFSKEDSCLGVDKFH